MPSILNLSELSFDIEMSVHAFHEDPLVPFDRAEDESAAPAKTVDMPVALVRARVNGMEPLTSGFGRPFDAATAILYAVEPGECDLYTCSCGVAGCAGLHEGVSVEVTESCVRWLFPMGTYRQYLQKPFSDELADTLVISFDRTQYFEALASLETQLKALAKEYPQMQVAPCESYGDPQESCFDVTWDRCVEHANRYHEAQHMYKEVFSDMSDLSLVLQTPLGEFSLSPAQLRAAIAPDAVRLDASPEIAEDYREAAARMQSTRDHPMEFVRSLDWAEVQLQAWYCGPGNAADNAAPVDDDNPKLVELPENADAQFLSAISAQWERR